MVINELEGWSETSFAAHQRRHTVRNRYHDLLERRQGRIREHCQERGPASHRGRRGRFEATLRQLYRQRQSLHAARESQKQIHRRSMRSPDERLMRSIEEKIDIPDGRKDDFRREIMNYIGALSIDGKQRSTTSPTNVLYKALAVQIIRRSKGFDQTNQPGVERRGPGGPRQKIDVVKRPVDTGLRLRRRKCHGRS